MLSTGWANLRNEGVKGSGICTNHMQLELNQANELYSEFLEYRENKAPGEEYELVQHWAEDLKLDASFELVFNDEHRRTTNDDVLSEMENDPFALKPKTLPKNEK